MGWGELEGIANRSDYDLKAHGLKYQDEEAGEDLVPYVVEPSGEITQVWNYAPWLGWRPPDGGWAYTSDTVERLSGAELAALVKGL